MGAKRKYVVALTEEEREYLKKLIQKGKVSGFRMRHAQILMKLDDAPENKGWTEERIAQAYSSNPVSVCHIARRFVEEGLESALSRREQKNRARKIDGEVEAKVIALACSNPPEGHERWTLRLLRDEVVRLEIADIERASVNNILKKMNSSRGV
jgi:DNA-binding MarR family transcriptional regulator